MEHLLEVAQIVTKKKVKKIEIFDELSLEQKNSKFNEFYEALLTDKFATDEDAADFLYGCHPNDDKYRQLKSRFKKRLLNTLFFLDINQPATSNYVRAYYSCNKDWTLVKILRSNQAQSTAAYLARQILTVALKFKFADVIVNCSRILREYYALIDADEKAYEEYDRYCKQYQNVQDAEIRSEELYQRVVINYKKPLSKSVDFIKTLDVYCETLNALSKIYDSPIVHYNRYMVEIYRYEMLGNAEKMLEFCAEAEAYVKANPNYYRNDKLAEIMMKRLAALLYMRYSVSEIKTNETKSKEKLLKTLEKSDIWFDLMEYCLLAHLHSNLYHRAAQLFLQIIDHHRFKGLSGIAKEKWAIFESFFCYLQLFMPDLFSETKKGKAKKLKKVKPKGLLTEPKLIACPIHSYKVLHIILLVLFLLEEGQKKEALNRIEELAVLSTKQLKKEEDFRTRQFIRLLQQLAKADFDYAKIGVHKKYLTQMDEMPFRYRGFPNELEVIRYEDLWDLLLQRLSRSEA